MAGEPTCARDLTACAGWCAMSFCKTRAIYYKRLEKGTYEMPEINSTSASIELDAQQLLLILEGISLLSVKKRRRYAQHFVDKKSMNTVHSEV
jgi:hypothetical protein